MPGPQHVTDPRSHIRDQIANAAEAIGRSQRKRKVFAWVNRGRNSYRTVDELAKLAKIPRQGVLDAAKGLVDSGIIHQINKGKGIAYQKDSVLKHHRKKILSLAGNPKKLKSYPTKTNPQIILRTPNIRFPKSFYVKARQIYIDDVSSFAKVKSVRASSVTVAPMKEAKFKAGVQRILGVKWKFQDWGGEKSDLYTSTVRIAGKRTATAFAFKGPGMTGRLTPKKMGLNGDQIQRLYSSIAAEAYLLQYWNQIDESVVEQMKMLAVAKSALERKPVCFGVIDGTDSARLIKAYPKQFK